MMSPKLSQLIAKLKSNPNLITQTFEDGESIISFAVAEKEFKLAWELLAHHPDKSHYGVGHKREGMFSDAVKLYCWAIQRGCKKTQHRLMENAGEDITQFIGGAFIFAVCIGQRTVVCDILHPSEERRHSTQYLQRRCREILAFTDSFGNTALHLATHYKHNRLVEYLLMQGADYFQMNNHQASPATILFNRDIKTGLKCFDLVYRNAQPQQKRQLLDQLSQFHTRAGIEPCNKQNVYDAVLTYLRSKVSRQFIQSINMTLQSMVRDHIPMPQPLEMTREEIAIQPETEVKTSSLTNSL